MNIVPDTISFILPIYIIDSSDAPVINKADSDFDISYSRADDGNAGPTLVSLSAGTRGTWSSGGIIKKDDTNAPGVYEFGVPNAALAEGSNYVTFNILISGAKAREITIQLSPVSSQLADGVAHGGTPGSSTATLALARVELLPEDGFTGEATVWVRSQSGQFAGVEIDSPSGVGSAGPALALYGDSLNTYPIVEISGGGHGISIDAGSGKHDIALLGSGDLLGTIGGFSDTALAQDIGNTVTLADALLAAYAQGSGDWVIDPVAKTLTLKLKDDSTHLVFDLDAFPNPLTRTKQ